MHETLFIKAGLFDIIGNFFSERALDALGAIILIAAALITRRYILPLLKTQLARETARHILIIADDVTDYFAQKYPNAHWSIWLDRAVDKIIEVTGVGREVAARAAQAAICRKGRSGQYSPPTQAGKIEAQT